MESLRDVGMSGEMYSVRLETLPHLQRPVLHPVPRGHPTQPGCVQVSCPPQPPSLGSSVMALPYRLVLEIGDAVTELDSFTAIGKI